jgi:two-component system chemotaxis sensor kinase CheA
VNDELITEFLAETNESLERLEQDFIYLEQNPSDANIINNIFRVMHTIKGTSGFIGLARLGKVAHAAENVMDQLRSGKLQANAEVISLIFEANDKVKYITEYLGEHGIEPDGNDAELIARLNEVATNGGVKKKAASAKKPTAKAAKKAPAKAKAGKGKAAKASKANKVKATKAKPAKKSKKAASKTPDLDTEIDFEPIPADYSDMGLDNEIVAVNDLDEVIDFTPIMADYALEEKSQEKAPSLAIKPLSEALAKLEKDKKEGPSIQQSIRVNLDVLERLMQMVGELVLTRNQLLQLKRNTKSSLATEFDAPLQRLNHITTDLQEGVMKTRMQSIGSAWSKFPRLVRDLSLELGKNIELRTVGEDTELDRQMLEAIKDPLTHMVRNSIDHGIEKPEERVREGKKAVGIITLSAYHEGGHIIIKIADDGKGLDSEKIKTKAIEKGIITAADVTTMTEKQIFQLVMKPGFSTAEKVTAVSGRGVGMDVVVSNIEKISGTIEIASKRGLGTEFTIKLPLTLAIMPVLIFQAGGEIFAIPQIRVQEIVKVEERSAEDIAANDNSKTHFIEEINGARVLRLRNKLLSLISIRDALGIDSESSHTENFVVVCEIGSNIFGILVDKVFHTEEIVVKPKIPMIADLEVYSGSTILGDGNVIMIIDPSGILKLSGIVALNESNHDDKVESIFDEEEISFLTFSVTSDKTPKAIPLELISRLEEIDLSKIEYSGSHKVVQYRGALMRMVSISGDIPTSGVHSVIVFVDRNKVMGLVVEKISDIVKMKMDIKSSISSNGLLGSMIINEVTTDVIDVSYYFSREFEGWLSHAESNIIEGSTENESLYKAHILLVDDSPFFRKFMRPVILAANYRVSTCENGLDALKLLEENHNEIDLVITDIDMPVMNGIEFIVNAKAHENIKNIPFIAMTSHEEKDLGDSPNDLGFDGFVPKSERDNVVKLIGDILDINGLKNSKKVAND